MSGWNTEFWRDKLGSCGQDVLIGHNVVFTNPESVFLGNHVRIDPFCLITATLQTGDFVHVCSHAVLGGGKLQRVVLKGWNFIGYGSKLFTASEDYSGAGGPVMEHWNPDNKVERGDIVFEDFSGVASDVIVMPKARLPKGMTVGMKSLVWATNIYTPWAKYWGNPIQYQCMRDKEKILEVADKIQAEMNAVGDGKCG